MCSPIRRHAHVWALFVDVHPGWEAADLLLNPPCHCAGVQSTPAGSGNLRVVGQLVAEILEASVVEARILERLARAGRARPHTLPGGHKQLPCGSKDKQPHHENA